MPDMDTDAHTPKGATHDHQETMDGLAAMPSPGAAETDGDHAPTCHQPTTGGRDRPGQPQKGEKRWERMERAGTDNPHDQASEDGGTDAKRTDTAGDRDGGGQG